jgi:hypothetical protein
MKNASDTIGSRTRDLPACSATACPQHTYGNICGIKCKGVLVQAMKAQAYIGVVEV